MYKHVVQFIDISTVLDCAETTKAHLVSKQIYKKEKQTKGYYYEMTSYKIIM